MQIYATAHDFFEFLIHARLNKHFKRKHDHILDASSKRDIVIVFCEAILLPWMRPQWLQENIYAEATKVGNTVDKQKGIFQAAIPIECWHWKEFQTWSVSNSLSLRHRPGFTWLHKASCWIWPCLLSNLVLQVAVLVPWPNSRWRNGHWHHWMRAVSFIFLIVFVAVSFSWFVVPRCWQFWTSCALSCLYSPHVLWRVKLSPDLLMNSSGKMKSFEVTSSQLCGPATASLSFCCFWSLWSTASTVGFREFHIQQPSYWAGVQLFSPLGHFCKCWPSYDS